MTSSVDCPARACVEDVVVTCVASCTEQAGSTVRQLGNFLQVPMLSCMLPQAVAREHTSNNVLQAGCCACTRPTAAEQAPLTAPAAAWLPQHSMRAELWLQALLEHQVPHDSRVSYLPGCRSEGL